jgi:3-phosphoshikimate 1-carboxyvinyltransferase
MAEELKKFGASVTLSEDEIVIDPAPLHSPAQPLFGHNDHRVVMSLAVLATKYGGIIRGAEAVNKSFPDFFARLADLGADITF